MLTLILISRGMENSSLRLITNIIALTVLGVWCVSFIVDMALIRYDPPAAINAIMLIVVGSIFGGSVIKKSGNGN